MSQIGDFISGAHSLRRLFLTLLVCFDLANALATLAHQGQASQAGFCRTALHGDVESRCRDGEFHVAKYAVVVLALALSRRG
jgi:hypothetical protein